MFYKHIPSNLKAAFWARLDRSSHYIHEESSHVCTSFIWHTSQFPPLCYVALKRPSGNVAFLEVYSVPLDDLLLFYFSCSVLFHCPVVIYYFSIFLSLDSRPGEHLWTKAVIIFVLSKTRGVRVEKVSTNLSHQILVEEMIFSVGMNRFLPYHI